MAKLKHLELPNGSNYDIYGVNVQEISYDDYEELTPTQKNSDIAYCITDTPYEVDDSIYGESSGAIASFNNGSANPLKSLVVDINPIQDLHGYDKPWAGGAGANIWDEEVEHGSIDNSTGALIDAPTLYRSKNKINVTGGQTYYFAANYGVLVYQYASDDSFIKYTDNVGTVIKSFTVESNTAYIRLRLFSNVTDPTLVKNSINYPSTITTYQPYSNICPISGRSSVEVTVAGTNIWDEEWEQGGLANATGAPFAATDRIRSTNFSPCLGSVNYYGKAPTNYLSIFWYDSNKSYISWEGASNKVITSPVDARFFKIVLSNGVQTYNNDISVNYPSTDTSYHEYVGTTETITIGQEVYGGELDVTDEVIHPYKYYASYNGETLVGRWISSLDEYEEGATPTTGAQVVDFGAFDSDIIITPTTISSRNGVNNIWTDSGDVDVVYITSDFIYNELRMNDTVIASNSFAYHSIESESATMAGHANTANNAQTVNGHTVASDVPSNATFTDTTYTFANGTNGFTVTPSGGTAQTVTVTPSITNNVTGSGTSGYLAKFNGTNTITNGAQLGSDTTKFLRNDGEWAVPPGAGGGVTGVKGNAESTYRTGNVNLTPANLGLESKSAASGGTDLSLVTTGEKYTWNSKASSDEKVKQTSTSTDADYEILFSESASDTTKTEGARKYSNLKFNPSTGNLQTTKINGIPLTSSPKFTDSKTQLTEDTGSWNTRTPYHMNTDAYSICMDSSSIDSGTPQSGVRGCDYSRRIAIHPNSSAISIGSCYHGYSRYLYDAIGFASVAISGGDDEESQYTTSGASGTASISVGTACHANANNTVAIGDHIDANGKYEFSFGRYNVSGRSSLPIVDGDYDYDAEGTYVETVGNGTSSTRSNARTLDWSGNEWLAGTLTASGATINGSISASGSISVSENILSDDSSLDITTSAAPSSDYWSLRGIYLRDTNQTEFGRVRGYYLTDGEVGVEYETKRTVGGTVKYNNLNLGIDSSGNNVVSVSSPSAWRTAIGVKDWVEVDHKGGTTAIPIPSGTTEICCVITVGNNTIAWTFTLPYAALSSTSWKYTNAYTSVSDGYIAVNVSTAQVSLNAVYNGTTNVTNSSIIYLYAR